MRSISFFQQEHDFRDFLYIIRRTNLFGQKNLDKRSNSNCGRRYGM